MEPDHDTVTDLPLNETRAWLVEHAHRRFARIPADVIAEHVLAITVGGDFPVRRAALEALHRRMLSVSSERLTVASAPSSGLGRYVLVRKPEPGQSRSNGDRRETRPYETLLKRVAPEHGECTCPDYRKGSLGLCKHLLAVLAFVYDKPRRLERARDASTRIVSDEKRVRLVWNPIIPLEGDGDPLHGLRLDSTTGGPGLEGFTRDGTVAIRRLRSAEARHAFLDATIRAISRGSGSAAIDAGPAVRAMLSDELAAAKRIADAEREAPRILRSLGGLKRSLYGYQREGVERFVRRGRLLLADDMGLGKTTQAIAACHAVYHAGSVKRGMIVTPASLKPQWLREWQATTDVPIALVDGGAREREKLYRETTRGFLLVNYEIVLRDFDRLLPFAREMVVLDEAQRIKNWATKSAVFVKALPAERRLVLTGTPMENRLEELASVLDWIDDRALAPKWRLPAWYIRYEGDGLKGQAGARNLQTLRSRIASCVVRRHRSDVLDQLPSRTDTRVPVAMTAEQIEAHDALAPPIQSLLRNAERRPLTQPQFLKLMQLLTTQRIIANGLAQLHFDEHWPALDRTHPTRAVLDGLFAPKLYEVRRLIEALVVEQGRKVVVFSQWRRMLKLAAWSVGDLLATANRRAVYFTGAESTRQRTQSITEFHDDPRTAVMFLSDAGGVGLNLQHAANACINLEMPWNPAVLEQRIGRIHRLGQKRPIDVFNLVSEPSIESRIAMSVGAKHALFKGLFDATTNELTFEAKGGFVGDVRRMVGEAGPAAPDVETETETASDVPAQFAEGTGAVDDVMPGDMAANTPIDVVQPSGVLADDGVAKLLSELRISATPDGGMRIDAPPSAAAALATLFDTMARMLRTSATG